MNILITFFNIIFICISGFIVTDIFLHEFSFPIKISLSYLVGIGLIAIQMLVMNQIGIHWSYLSIIFPWVVVGSFYFGMNIYKIGNFAERIQHQSIKFTKIEIILFTLIVFLGLFTLFESIIRPVQTWDGWDNWVFRSNVFYEKQTIDKYYFKYTSDEYPLVLPLTGTFGYYALGEIDDTAILLYYYAFYAVLGSAFYSFSRNYINRKNTLLFTFLLLSTQNVIRHGGRYEVGQADLAVGVFIFSCIFLLHQLIKERSALSFLLFNFLIGITFQIKNDAIPFVVTMLFVEIIVFISGKNYKRLILLLPALILVGNWLLFKSINHLSPHFLIRSHTIFHFERIPIIILGFIREFLNFQNWSLLWIIFILILVFKLKTIRKYWLFVLALVVQIAGYGIAFLLTGYDPAQHMNNILNKLLLHVAPIAIFLIAIALDEIQKLSFEVNPKKRNSKKSM